MFKEGDIFMLTQDSKIIVNGKTCTIPEFMEKFGLDDMDEALLIVEKLVQTGKARIPENISKDTEMLKDAKEKVEFDNIVNAIEAEEEANKKYLREQSIKDKDVMDISLDYATTLEATKAEAEINAMGIEDTEITLKKGAILLVIRNISQEEYVKIAKSYQRNKAISNVVNVTDKAFTSATDAINYGAENVVAPMAKIAGKAGMNIGKGLVHAGLQVGAGLVNNGAKAINETKIELATDKELLKAKKQLANAKDTILGFARKKFSGAKTGSGINIL